MLGHESVESLRLRGFIQITRPPNGLLMMFAVLVGYFVQSGRLPGAWEGILAALTAYTLSASSMVVNDIIDREIDQINNPRRPIPSGIVKTSEAVAFSIVLGAIGISSSSVLGFHTLVIALIFYGLALLYNMRLKREGLLGNAAVSASIAAPYIYGAFLAEGTVGIPVGLIATMSFLSGMGREIIKGIADVTGDMNRGIRTFAISRGRKAAAKLGTILVFIAILLSPIPVITGSMGLLYIPLVAAADVGFIYSSLRLMRNIELSNKTKKEYLFWMFIALLGFLLGAIKF